MALRSKTGEKIGQQGVIGHLPREISRKFYYDYGGEIEALVSSIVFRSPTTMVWSGNTDGLEKFQI